jgi:hypothetical protein
MQKRGGGRRGPKGRNNKPPTSTSKKKNKKRGKGGENAVNDGFRGFMDGLKELGNVHCVSLSRTHMSASEHEPLNILISPFLFKYLETFDHDPVREEPAKGDGEGEEGETLPELPAGCVRELGLAYRRLFQVFDDTDFVPPISITLPFSNERIHSFQHVTILPGLLHYKTFKHALPEELQDDPSRWINDPDNFLKVPLTKDGSNHLFLLLGSDPCVHHPSNMCRSMVNNALVHYSLLSRLGFTWDNIHHCLVTLLPQRPEKDDPPLMNRVLRMVTVMASRKTSVALSSEEKGDRFIASTPVDYSQEDYRYIEGMIGYGFSSLSVSEPEKEESCPPPSVSSGEEEEGEKESCVEETKADVVLPEVEDLLSSPGSSEDEYTRETTGDEEDRPNQ